MSKQQTKNELKEILIDWKDIVVTVIIFILAAIGLFATIYWVGSAILNSEDADIEVSGTVEYDDLYDKLYDLTGYVIDLQQKTSMLEEYLDIEVCEVTDTYTDIPWKYYHSFL